MLPTMLGMLYQPRFLASFTCSTYAPGGVRHIQIATTARTGHGGGLVRRFDPADENLCLRRVKYRFSFSDPTPDASHRSRYARLCIFLFE